MELTTKFRGISTSPVAKQNAGKNTSPLKRCYGALNYIMRDSAAGLRCWRGLTDETREEARTDQAASLALRRRFREEFARGGKVGRRIATTGVISLPNSWKDDTVQQAMQRLSVTLAPEGSKASVLIVQHTDRSNNAHLHFITVDGEESTESALARTGGANQRLRRRNVQRFNERGAPKMWRGRIAGVLNAVAEECHEVGVEWRSFKDRGLRRKPTRHDGPIRRAIQAKSSGMDEVIDFLNRGTTIDDSLDNILPVVDRLLRGLSDMTSSKGGEQRQRE